MWPVVLLFIVFVFSLYFTWSSEFRHQEHSPSATTAIGPATITHDFGLLRPNQVIEHRFVIHNPSDSQWTISGIERSCSCTVTQASSSNIPAHGAAHIDVRYTAPSVNSDVHKWVTVFMREEEVAPVILELKATVRERIAVVPAQIVLSETTVPQSPNAHFEVQNFSETDWNSINVETEVDWLNLHVTSIPLDHSSGTPRMPRQLWRIDLSPTTTGLKAGPHRAVILIQSTGNLTQSVPVDVHVSRRVTASPSQFFFGTIASDKATKSSVVLRFARNEFPDDDSALHFRYRGNGQMSFTSQRIPRTSRWKVTATLGAGRPGDMRDQYLKGSVAVSFSQSGNRSFTIPVHGVFAE